MTAALVPIAEAFTRPVQLVLTETSPKRRKHPQTAGRLERNSIARDYASTLTSLMELESNIEKLIKESLDNYEEQSKIHRLRVRLLAVQDQIEIAERPLRGEIGSISSDYD
jgi:hypothetical protein